MTIRPRAKHKNSTKMALISCPRSSYTYILCFYRVDSGCMYGWHFRLEEWRIATQVPDLTLIKGCGFTETSAVCVLKVNVHAKLLCMTPGELVLPYLQLRRLSSRVPPLLPPPLHPCCTPPSSPRWRSRWSGGEPSPAALSSQSRPSPISPRRQDAGDNSKRA